MSEGSENDTSPQDAKLTEPASAPIPQHDPFADVPPAEDFLPSPQKEPGPFRRWPPLFPAFSLPLSLAVLSLIVSLTHWNANIDFFSVSRLQVFEGREYWRVVSALFNHADISHWGLNMMPFLFFGWLISAYFGPRVFALGAFVIGIGSNVATISFYAPETSLLGASGVVYGIIAMWLIFYLKFDDENILAKKSMRVIGFILMLLFPTAYEPSTSYLAHATGFSFGVITAGILLPFVKVRLYKLPQPYRRIYVRRIFRVRRTNFENNERLP